VLCMVPFLSVPLITLVVICRFDLLIMVRLACWENDCKVQAMQKTMRNDRYIFMEIVLYILLRAKFK
jgi:hypothetical protein